MGWLWLHQRFFQEVGLRTASSESDFHLAPRSGQHAAAPLSTVAVSRLEGGARLPSRHSFWRLLWGSQTFLAPTENRQWISCVFAGKFGGKFGGKWLILSDSQNKALAFWKEKIRAFFVRRLVTQKFLSCQLRSADIPP